MKAWEIWVSENRFPTGVEPNPGEGYGPMRFNARFDDSGRACREINWYLGQGYWAEMRWMENKENMEHNGRLEIRDLLLILVKRYHADRKANEGYIEMRTRNIARVTLDSFMHNIALELRPFGLTLEGLEPKEEKAT